jgi:beta-lactamase regulating signal transducer with metallopeptidase domain
MTTFGIALATAAVQVTLAALVALVVVAYLTRRSPRTAVAISAAGLGLCALLTLGATVAIPGWWTWDSLPNPPTAAASAFTKRPVPTTSTSSEFSFPIRRLLSLLPQPPARPGESQSHRTVWTIIPFAILAGAAWELFRLVAAVVAVGRIRRRSVVVADVTLLAEVDALRQTLGLRSRVAVHESAAVGTAATVGWRQPVILLAADWPVWRPAERRAVLAHELAHVLRRDYLVNLAATACRAVHFYHPLVRRLVARLRLSQELAADAAAAAAAGGKAAYLRALARLALRQDAALVAGAARPFLSDYGSLLRRVAMLRVTDDGRPLGRAKQWTLTAVVVAAALAASAVRGPAQSPAESTAKPATEAPPFDLTALPANVKGVFAVRPAALAAIPGMKPVIENLSRSLKAALNDLELAPGIELPLEQIEQAVFTLDVSEISDADRKRNGNEARHSLTAGVSLIRMTHDFDWAAKIRKLSPAVKVEECKPNHFRCEAKVVGPIPFDLVVRDFRTLIMESGKSGNEPDATRWGRAWGEVCREPIAVAFDNRDGHWAKAIGDRSAAEITPAAGTLLARTTHLALGVRADRQAGGVFATDSADEAGARATVEAIDAVGQFARLATAAALKANPTGPERAWLQLAADVFERQPVLADGILVRVEGRSKVALADLVGQVFNRPPQGGEK